VHVLAQGVFFQTILEEQTSDMEKKLKQEWYRSHFQHIMCEE